MNEELLNQHGVRVTIAADAYGPWSGVASVGRDFIALLADGHLGGSFTPNVVIRIAPPPPPPDDESDPDLNLELDPAVMKVVASTPPDGGWDEDRALLILTPAETVIQRECWRHRDGERTVQAVATLTPDQAAELAPSIDRLIDAIEVHQ